MLFFLLLSDIETISFFIRWMSSIVERFSINWQKTGWKWRKKKPFKKQNIFFHFVLLNEVQKHVSNKKNQRSMNWTRSGERIKSYNFPFQMAIYFVYLFSIMIFLFPYFFYTLLLNDHIVLRGNDSRMLETLITIGFWHAYTANIAKVKEIYK